MKLVVGKTNIHDYKTKTPIRSGDLERSDVYITFRTENGIIHPALVVFEKSDFNEIVLPKPEEDR